MQFPDIMGFLLVLLPVENNPESQPNFLSSRMVF